MTAEELRGALAEAGAGVAVVKWAVDCVRVAWPRMPWAFAPGFAVGFGLGWMVAWQVALGAELREPAVQAVCILGGLAIAAGAVVITEQHKAARRRSDRVARAFVPRG